MSATTALLKKELHTAKWFLLGGVLFFWSFPLTEGIGTYFRSGTFRTDMPSGMSWMFGGLFAIIAACGMVCMDMPKGLYEFWRSRPIRLVPYLVVKYVVGLAVVVFVITVPILLEMYLLRNADGSYSFGRSILCCHTFIILLIYSVGFCAGHLFGNMTEAAIISFAAALLVYFVPVLVPVLEPLSFFNIVSDGPAPTVEIITKSGKFHQSEMAEVHPSGVSRVLLKGQWGHSLCGDRHMYWMPISAKSLLIVYLFKGFWLFTSTMTALSVAMIAGAWASLKYHLQIRMGMKSLCWSLGVALLMIFVITAFAEGSNLNSRTLPTIEYRKDNIKAETYYFDDNGGIVFYGRECRDSNEPSDGERKISGCNIVRIEQYKENISLAKAPEVYLLDKPIYWDSNTRALIRPGQKPNVIYCLKSQDIFLSEENRSLKYSLCIFELNDQLHTVRLSAEIPLGELSEADTKKHAIWDRNMVLDNAALYIQIFADIVVFDIGDGLQPRLLTRCEYKERFTETPYGKVGSLPSDPNLSDRQRRFVLQNFGAFHSGTVMGWDGDMFAEVGQDSIYVYKIKDSNADEIQFERVAGQNIPLLKKALSSYGWPKKVILRNNLIYVSSFYSLTVYRLNETSATIRQIGHYVSPEGNFYDMSLRDDGRIVLNGYKQIHIVQPPAVKGR